MDKKDRIRYTKTYELKVTEELRDAKWNQSRSDSYEFMR